jgi:hypothetical protein
VHIGRYEAQGDSAARRVGLTVDSVPLCTKRMTLHTTTSLRLLSFRLISPLAQLSRTNGNAIDRMDLLEMVDYWPPINA